MPARRVPIQAASSWHAGCRHAPNRPLLLFGCLGNPEVPYWEGSGQEVMSEVPEVQGIEAAGRHE